MMDLSKLAGGLGRGHAENIRAAWLFGNDAEAGVSGEAFLYCVYASCEGWRYGFWRAGKIRLPLFGSTLEGALGAFLAAPPTNYNMALLACRFGQQLLDQDGSGEMLSAKAAELWNVGPPALDPARLPRLLWEMKRICADVERWSEACPRDARERVRHEALLTVVLERALVAYYRAQGFWSLPMTELYRAAEDERYKHLAHWVEEFLATGNLAGKAQAVLAVAQFVIAAIPAPPDQGPGGVSPASVWRGGIGAAASTGPE